MGVLQIQYCSSLDPRRGSNALIRAPSSDRALWCVRPCYGRRLQAPHCGSTARVRRPTVPTRCSQHSANGQGSHATMPPPRSPFQTGGTLPGLHGGPNRLTKDGEGLPAEKFIVVVRHGLTTWNESSRIQGDSDEAKLTKFGEQQAARVRDALINMHFDSCFASPIQRAFKFAEIAWASRPGPLIPFELLKEANLGWLQGMSNADAAKNHPEEFRMWREQPAKFMIDGVNPVEAVFDRAKNAWHEILDAEGNSHLLVTHKSIMRAMMCVALGLPTSSFRAVEINNGGVSIFRINRAAEPMLVNMNMTAHMHLEGVKY